MHPVLFHVGTLPIGTYALFVMLATAAGVTTFALLAGREGFSRTGFAELGLWAFVIALFTSKVFGAVVAYDPARPRESLVYALRFGGHYYIGFIAGSAFLVLAFRRHGISLARGLDILAPALALAHGIGRVGCLFAGCCWGKACSLPWAVTFTSPDAHSMTGVPLGIPLQPTQVYESLIELALFGFLLWKALKAPWRPGTTFLAYVALYGFARFGLEMLRDDPRGRFLGMPTSQPLAAASATFACALLAAMAWHDWRGAGGKRAADSDGKSSRPRRA
jgi:phosphatidylglycerol:prolipoprotein diacylglycerol transferase